MDSLPRNGFGPETAAHIAARPGVQRVPSPKLQLFIKRGFLSDEECEALIAMIERDRRPSTLSDYNGDATFRTSETCDLPMTDPLVAAIEHRIAGFIGIDDAFGEQLQGQRYDVGQEFKDHTDYFEPSGQDFAKYCTVSGQRSWTGMVYLNAVEAGGATRFKAIDKIVQPEAGKLLAWSNLRADGTPNPSTLHHGMKVRRGVKYIITKWFREREWPRG